MGYGNSNGKGSGGFGTGEANGDTARAAYYDQLERVTKSLRAHLDTFGETIRRARGVEGLDRSLTDREVALQLRLTASTFREVANGISPNLRTPPRPADEVTTETKRIKRRAPGTDEDSSPGHKGR